jgi:ribonuclease E
MTGISRKLPDTERSRLKSILKRVLPENAGVIVRTASEGASEEELSRDVARLSAQWDDIHAKSKTASAPSLLYAEPDLTVRVIRDIFNEDFAKLVVAGPGAWETVEPYVAHVAPDLADRLERWTSEKDVWSEFRIDEQLAKALDRKVWLPSGGSLVIDRTEAMTVIDVNTGKFTGQGGNLEQTVTENNLEAAEEIVRQLRLRDIGGIIVVDFIDMVLESNRELVLRRLIECLGRDRTKHQVAEVTSLGLVQMTRKRVGQGLLEVFSTTCDACNGRGLHVHMEPVDDQQRRRGESDGRGKDGKDKSDKSKGGKSKGKDGKDKSDKDKSDKDKGKGSKDKAASDESGSDTAVDAVPGASADQGGITLAPENGSSEGPAPEGGRRQRRRGRGGAGASDQDGGSSSEPVATAPSVSEPADSAAPAPEAAPPVEPVRAAPVLAPRGIDLTPDLLPATTPKRRRRAASRPAGAPTGQESGS